MELNRRQFLRYGGAAIGLGLVAPTALLADELGDLLKQLTPKKYQKKPDQFEFTLTEVKNSWLPQNPQRVLESLVQNLSLHSNSLTRDLRVSEDIRQTIKPHLNFEGQIESYLEQEKQTGRQIDSLHTLLDSQLTPENRNSLENQLQPQLHYRSSLRQQIALTRETMYWLRWHASEGLNKKVNFKQAKKNYTLAKDALYALKIALVKKDYPLSLELLQIFRRRFTLGTDLFSQDISTLLKQAETEINKNLKSLTQIEYQGKSHYASLRFAQEWDQVNKTLQVLNNNQPKIVYWSKERLIVADLQGHSFLEEVSTRVPSYQWSPDNQKLLVETFKGPDYILDLRFHTRQPLPPGSNFSWSPDSKHITYHRDKDIYIDGKKITGNKRNNTLPAWSPNNQWIAFDSFKSNREIRIINPKSQIEKALVEYQWQNSPYGHSQFQWSSDSQIIFYQSREKPPLQIFSIDLNHNKIQLTETGKNYSPVLSPNGNQIAFISERDGRPEIYLMNSNGQNQKRLSQNQAISAPTWSPDSQSIFYSSTNGHIYSVNTTNNKTEKFKEGIKPLFSPK